MSAWAAIDEDGELCHFLALAAGALPGLPAFIAAVRAVDSAMATACFWGLPDFTSFEMLDEMLALE